MYQIMLKCNFSATRTDTIKTWTFHRGRRRYVSHRKKKNMNNRNIINVRNYYCNMKLNMTFHWSALLWLEQCRRLMSRWGEKKKNKRKKRLWTTKVGEEEKACHSWWKSKIQFLPSITKLPIKFFLVQKFIGPQYVTNYVSDQGSDHFFFV